MTNRRDFIRQLPLIIGATAASPQILSACNPGPKVPSYLKAYGDLYASDPRQAALAWFRDARFGLFMHYGLYSLWGRGAWVQLEEKIPVAEYVKLKKEFTAERFDADFITDLAIEAGMKYVNITTKHHDGFCLFKTNQTDYNSMEAAARRDLVGELRDACDKKGLGLFLYYSIAADWHHPYFCSPEAGWEFFRPAYAEPQPEYLYRTEKDFENYIDYARKQLRELVTQYRPAGIWFDPAMGFYAQARLFPMEELYNEIRSLNPATLISFKQGATGTEDFAAPERDARSLHEKVTEQFGEAAGRVAQQAWEANADKYNETSSTLQLRGWAYMAENSERHRHLEVEEVLELLREANEVRGMNLLMNTGPMPDGSIHPTDVDTLRKVGQRLRG